MDSCETYVRRVFFGALGLILVFSGTLAVAGVPAWARGVALGGSASLVNLLLLAKGAKKQVALPDDRGGILGPSMIFVLRMGVTAAALLFAASDDRVSLWASIPALFVAQVVLVVGDLTGMTEGRD